IRDLIVTGVQTCALPIFPRRRRSESKSARAWLQRSVIRGLSSTPVGLFFIDTATGQVATQRQLIESGVADRDGLPPRPWHRIQRSEERRVGEECRCGREG